MTIASACTDVGLVFLKNFLWTTPPPPPSSFSILNFNSAPKLAIYLKNNSQPPSISQIQILYSCIHCIEYSYPLNRLLLCSLSFKVGVDEIRKLKAVHRRDVIKFGFCVTKCDKNFTCLHGPTHILKVYCRVVMHLPQDVKILVRILSKTDVNYTEWLPPRQSSVAVAVELRSGYRHASLSLVSQYFNGLFRKKKQANT